MRCRNCGNWLRFVGIQVAPSWLRWDACDHCGLWRFGTALGLAVGWTHEEPRRGLFASGH